VGRAAACAAAALDAPSSLSLSFSTSLVRATEACCCAADALLICEVTELIAMIYLSLQVDINDGIIAIVNRLSAINKQALAFFKNIFEMAA
jgi:hypothetical protein